MDDQDQAVAAAGEGDSQGQTMSLMERSERIYESARRLRKFCQLKAPGIVIEQERVVLLRKLINFPALPEHIEARERIDAEVSKAEFEFLREHGFFDDIVKGLEGEPS